jgi:uncharacterized membrane protein
MNNMLVVIFDNENNGREGVKVLKSLHHEGDISLYASVLIKKDAEGQVAVADGSDGLPLGTGFGMLTGSLVGMVGGPVGVAVGALAGTLGGASFDLVKLGINEDFVDEVGQHMSPGKVALVAELREEEPAWVDVRMNALGGIPFRQPRQDVIDSQFERDVNKLDAEILELESEFGQANEEAKAKIEAKINAAKSKLQATQEKVKARAEDAKREMEAKVELLKAQMEKANSEAKAKIEGRIEEIQAEHKQRTDEMRQSFERTQEAYAHWRYVQTHI